MIRSRSQKILLYLLNLFFPPACVGCGKINQILCPRCYSKIDFYPLPIQLNFEDKFLDDLTVCAYFLPPISNLIKTMKYQQFMAIGPWLGELLFLSSNCPDIDFIVPIPMHQKKQKIRGFNQAEEICYRFAELRNKTILPALIKKHHFAAQASISSKTERKKRANEFFALSNQITLPLTGKRILLIDDVCTTGSTLNEAAKTLKLAGARWVGGLVVAKKN
ncbi:MAG: ComF family protein [Patescibacteria group bacterium]